MVRVVKRYESRKLYDTEESRYVSLDEIAGFVRRGQEVRVLDNATGDDVTSQTLTQVILEEGRSGRPLSVDFLHDLVRRGERALTNGVEQVQQHVQQGVDRLVQASIERVGPLRRAREEMETLRGRLEELESSLSRLEDGPAPPRRRAAPKATAKKATAKKRAAATRKASAKRKASARRAARRAVES